jgi:hypothetical protein
MVNALHEFLLYFAKQGMEVPTEIVLPKATFARMFHDITFYMKQPPLKLPEIFKVNSPVSSKPVIIRRGS